MAWLTIFPSVVAVFILVGMIYHGGKIVADQLEATQENTQAIQALTRRMAAVEAVTVDTNVKVTNGS